MMAKFRKIFAAAAAAALAGQLDAVTMSELDIIADGKFKPVELHGRTTAAFGWEMYDQPRLKASGLHGNYLSGEGLFDIKVEDGILTVSFPNKLHNIYKNGVAEFEHTRPHLAFGADAKFRVRAKVKVNKGRFVFADGTEVKNSPD